MVVLFPGNISSENCTSKPPGAPLGDIEEAHTAGKVKKSAALSSESNVLFLWQIWRAE